MPAAYHPSPLAIASHRTSQISQGCMRHAPPFSFRFTENLVGRNGDDFKPLNVATPFVGEAMVAALDRLYVALRNE